MSIENAKILITDDSILARKQLIIASSVGTQSQLKLALEAGAKDFIQKPLDKDQVVKVVSKFLEGR